MAKCTSCSAPLPPNAILCEYCGTRNGTEHGVWLDGGELRHLFKWMKAGGEILDQEVREAEIGYLLKAGQPFKSRFSGALKFGAYEQLIHIKSLENIPD